MDTAFVPIQTKASAVLKKKAEFAVTVFEPKKAALKRKQTARPRPPPVEDRKTSDNEDDDDDIDDIFSDAPRRKPKSKADPTQFDLAKARKDIINFGISGFDKEDKQQASVALAIKLGAKPPKRKHRNYREILEEKKAAKTTEEDVAAKRRAGQADFGAVQSFQKQQQRKRDRERNPGAIMKHYGKARPRIGGKRK
ncbi:uncharacterized protein C1orf131 homolog [Anopheles darlingi]|uniref:uncharacterized protein C1orf131 homolog n=1 Tax=Anopheles darlingi TaxID=43151 RepID=UPI0021002E51|nr:uncharacterized protein C1orf131 homolog [Anopheles darlingi]